MDEVASKCADVISRMVLRVDLEEGYEEGAASSAPPQHQGPLAPQEMAELSCLCSATSSSNATNSNSDGFDKVELDQLMALVELLDRHVKLAVTVHWIENAVEIYQEVESPSLASSTFFQVCDDGLEERWKWN
jgi:hypothetical protein